MTDYRTKEQLREELSRRYAAADWPRVRQAVLRRDGYKCLTCGNSGKLRAHHKTYRHLWNELDHLEDMATQCVTCHHQGEYGDFRISEDRAAIWWINAASRILVILWAITQRLIRLAWWTAKKIIWLTVLLFLCVLWLLGLALAFARLPGLYHLAGHGIVHLVSDRH